MDAYTAIDAGSVFSFAAGGISTESDDWNKVEELLSSKPMLARVKDQHGDYAIHKACERGTLDAIDRLVPHSRAALSKPGARGWPPLHVACLQGRADVVAKLLGCISSSHGNVVAAECTALRHSARLVPPLGVACARGLSDAVLVLAKAGGPTWGPASADTDGLTPAHWAAAHGHGSCIMQLAQATEEACSSARQRLPTELDSVLAATAKDGSTPLHLACAGGHMKAAVWICDAGARRWARAQLAARRLSASSSSSAAAEGDQGSAATSSSSSSSVYASSSGVDSGGVGGGMEDQDALVREQTKYCENRLLGAADARGRTPMHVAAMAGHSSLVAQLVSRGGDMARGDHTGMTPAMLKKDAEAARVAAASAAMHAAGGEDAVET